MLDDLAIGALIGNKGFDNDWLRREFDARGALAVIPRGRSQDARLLRLRRGLVASLHGKLLLCPQDLSQGRDPIRRERSKVRHNPSGRHRPGVEVNVDRR